MTDEGYITVIFMYTISRVHKPELSSVSGYARAED